MPELTPEQMATLTELAMGCARRGESQTLLELIEQGMPVDLQDAAGNTALMLAAYSGHPDTVEALISRGADVDLRNARDQSPIAGALFKGEDKIVQMLVGAGADLDAGNPSARATAVMFGQTHLLS
ncbi:hypothetical protein C5B85_14795 [Pseudoclavibacter sp. AY1F1]|uniref:ankyrin repeat domain-containing protein n=1 Tax=Pseudoclavibacter sp. AY1F1 TaxID=2080583 RepID=UPI000CE8C88F|nr:ankyrin repeat domain-containing protein [Pseudoclavibacter sp. AY1F1]PPF42844.1 hypothetical protein C5B85_14795 [Pseudoclavibacter sp. AY1F1]